MFGRWFFLLARSWRGTEWEYFWLGLAAIICFYAWHWNNVFNSPPDDHVHPDARALAPVEEIDEFMERYDVEGYEVSKTRDLEVSARDSNRLLIGYVVMTEDHSEFWDYVWAWEVPRLLAFDTDLFDLELSEERIQELLGECRLVAVSGPAREVNDELMAFIEARKGE